MVKNRTTASDQFSVDSVTLTAESPRESKSASIFSAVPSAILYFKACCVVMDISLPSFRPSRSSTAIESPASTIWVNVNSSSTMPRAIAVLLFLFSAVDAISSRIKLITFSLPFLPDISTAVAAPMEAPPVIYIFSQDKEISAPADMALRLINATVSRSESKMASLIWVAASTRPPKVSISKMTARALFFSASASSREI